MRFDFLRTRMSFLTGIFCLGLMAGSSAFAAPASAPAVAGTKIAASTVSVVTAITAAKKRNYPGGRDEEDLTVQANLPVPSRTGEAQVQNQEDEPEQPADHD